ncbi:MAG: hypothetical protein A2Y10_00515 [Planctomycetes bacterium GWF2_41_51]|nr:MAG: hypothetical protein A2Y10_00515 [Planctomycetes bacterium GWF2_41_51]HBG26109.1 hypothetical protein [Phycisphaerales bacterium]
MNNEIRFKAPWGPLLIISTSACIIFLVGISIIGINTGPKHNIGWILGMVVLPLAILIISSFFIIRGYVLTDNNTLVIQRLGWDTKIDLAELTSAEVDKTAMAKSIRTFGNGGMFCFAGLFYNKRLGTYRAFATDLRKCVVLRFTNRIIVVTPDEPENFVMKIKTFIHHY